MIEIEDWTGRGGPVDLVELEADIRQFLEELRSDGFVIQRTSDSTSLNGGRCTPRPDA